MSKKIEDMLMKNVFDLFKGDTLKFFDINDEEVTAPAKTELNYVETQENMIDYSFYTNKDWIRHFEFQTTNKKDDLIRFMVSDAVMCYKQGKPVKTTVVYSADIKDVNTTYDGGSIKYEIDAFYMIKLDGDKKYDEIRCKIERKELLTKQDLMSMILLPIMKNSVDKSIRIEQCILLSKEIDDRDAQLQVQSMLNLLAEKFITDRAELIRIKEMLNMSVIAEMIREDALIEGKKEIAKEMLKDNVSIDTISKYTGLDNLAIMELALELGLIEEH